jgi:tetratricopeptide (TPR) repeat protein
VLWYSFYEPGANISSFFRTAAYYFTGSVSKSTPTIETIVGAMQKRRGIVVLDGLERQLLGFTAFDQVHREEHPQDSSRSCADARLAKLLSAVASIPGKGSKLLITSRLLPKELDDLAGVKELRLPGLAEEEAVEFLKREAMGVDEDTRRQVAKKYSGHPLALRLAAGLLTDPKHSHLTLGDEADTVLDSLVQGKSHILQTAFDALNDTDRYFLTMLSAFRGATSFDAAIAVLGEVDTNNFWQQVASLVDRGFLWTNRNHRLFDLHPIVRLYAYSRLTDKPGAANRIRDVFQALPKPVLLDSLDQAEPIFEICYQFTRANRYDEAFELLEEDLWVPVGVQFGESTLLLRLIELFFPNGWDRSSTVSIELEEKLISRSAQVLRVAKRYHEVISLLVGRLESASSRNFGDWSSQLGLCLFNIGRLSEGIAYVKRGLDVTTDRHTRGHVHHRLLMLYKSIGRYAEAREQLRQMEQCYKAAQMLDLSHSFSVRCEQFDLCNSLSAKAELMTIISGIAERLKWKHADSLLQERKVRFLIDRLERTHGKWAIQLWFSSSQPKPDEAAMAEEILDDLLLDARNAGLLDAEAKLLSLSARIAMHSDISRARAAALEAVRLAHRGEDIFTKLTSAEALASVEAAEGNRERQATLLRDALQLIPDEPLAASLRRRFSRRI